MVERGLDGRKEFAETRPGGFWRTRGRRLGMRSTTDRGTVAGVGTPTPVNPRSLSPNPMEFGGPVVAGVG